MIVVSDATPLIALAKINHLVLLQQLFTAILIPAAVYKEVAGQTAWHPGADLIRQASWIQVRPVQNTSRVIELAHDLDPGESETLILAEEIDADWVLLDERKARAIAAKRGFQFTGTVGILLLAKRT